MTGGIDAYKENSEWNEGKNECANFMKEIRYIHVKNSTKG